MKILLGGPESGKTTILLHYVYNEIVKLLENINTQTGEESKIASAKSSIVKSSIISGQIDPL